MSKLEMPHFIIFIWVKPSCIVNIVVMEKCIITDWMIDLLLKIFWHSEINMQVDSGKC